MLEQGQKVSYKDEEATILGFMKDGRVCIEILLGEYQTILYVNREDINATNA